MGTYATVQASLSYTDQKHFDKIMVELIKGKWAESPSIIINGKELTIEVVCDYFRNFPFDLVKEKSKGEIVWTTTDGDFQGGIIENGKEELFDLTKWASENDLSKETFLKANDEDTAELDWMDEVERAFHDEYAVII